MSGNPKTRKNNQTFRPSEPSEKVLNEFGSSADVTGLNALTIESSNAR